MRSGKRPLALLAAPVRISLTTMSDAPAAKRAKPALAEGVAFPAGPDGRVSTTAVGKKIWQSAAAPLSAELAEAISAERDWRHNYPQHVCRLADLGAQSPEAALTIAREGLAAVQSVRAAASSCSRGRPLESLLACFSAASPAPLARNSVYGPCATSPAAHDRNFPRACGG
jgi:hypothetical protein